MSQIVKLTVGICHHEVRVFTLLFFVVENESPFVTLVLRKNLILPSNCLVHVRRDVAFACLVIFFLRQVGVKIGVKAQPFHLLATCGEIGAFLISLQRSLDALLRVWCGFYNKMRLYFALSKHIVSLNEITSLDKQLEQGLSLYGIYYI